MAMTDELVALEMAHLALDKSLREGDKEVYTDPTFEDYDRDTEEEDNVLSYEYDMPPPEAGATASEEPSDKGNEGDWEDVETDVP